MKTKIFILFLSLSVIACNSDKQAQLTKLKGQRQSIDEKIKLLEADIASTTTDSLNPEKFKFIGIREVQPNAFDHYIRVQGKLDGDENASVHAEMPGTIIRKYFDVGQYVKKGQVLAQVDDDAFVKQLNAIQPQLDFALEVYEKQKRLWEQKVGSEVQYLQAKSSKESLEKQIELLKEQIEKYKIKSPIDGTIAECNIKVGSVVSPDPRLILYRVIAFQNLKVIAEVSEAYSARVQPGDKVNLILPDINKEIESKIDFVSKYINPVNRTFVIESKLSSNSPDLKANMIAIIQINDYSNPNAITVPMNVIQTESHISYVYVARPKDKFNAAYKQPVTIGMSYNGLAEITQGLKPGDKVVSVGYQELIDGEYIRF